MSEKKKPAHEVRRGSVKVVIWANDTASGVRYNLTPQKLYKPEGSTSWKTTQSFGAGDIPRLMRVLALCDDWIAGQTAASADEKAA